MTSYAGRTCPVRGRSNSRIAFRTGKVGSQDTFQHRGLWAVVRTKAGRIYYILATGVGSGYFIGGSWLVAGDTIVAGPSKVQRIVRIQEERFPVGVPQCVVRTVIRKIKRPVAVVAGVTGDRIVSAEWAQRLTGLSEFYKTVAAVTLRTAHPVLRKSDRSRSVSRQFKGRPDRFPGGVRVTGNTGSGSVNPIDPVYTVNAVDPVSSWRARNRIAGT